MLPNGSVFPTSRWFEVKSLANESGFEYRGKASPHRGIWGWRAKNGITGWWFGNVWNMFFFEFGTCFFLFFSHNKKGIILPIDFFFQRGWHHQPDHHSWVMHIKYCQLMSYILGTRDWSIGQSCLVRSQDETVLSFAAHLDKYGLGLCSPPTYLTLLSPGNRASFQARQHYQVGWAWEQLQPRSTSQDAVVTDHDVILTNLCLRPVASRLSGPCPWPQSPIQA